MKLYTDKLYRDDLEKIAAAMFIELYMYDFEGPRMRGRFKGKMMHKFLLRPTADDYRKATMDYTGRSRRAWAVSWAGHYVFMRTVFNFDSEAVIKSKAIKSSHFGNESMESRRKAWGMEYNGAEEFTEKAYATGATNIGSMIYPQEFWEAQAEGHVIWNNEADLIAITADITRQLIPELV